MVAEAEAALDDAARRGGQGASSRALLSGEADANDCYLEVHAGAGGTEAQDWAEMLLRMYVRWAEQHGYKVEWLEESAGEEAGIKSATIQVNGPERLWLAEDRERRAPAGAHLALRQPGAAPHQLRLGLGLSGGRRQHRDRDQRQGPARRHLPRLGRRRPARQQDRERGAHHPSADRHRRAVPERPLAAPEPRQRHGDAEGAALRARAAEARGGGGRRSRPARPTSAGATRSAPTCCSPTRW